jgi:hypothetical protein
VLFEQHEPFGSGEGQRPEEDGIERAENGGIRADAERKGQHGRQRQSGVPGEQAHGEDEVATHV